MINKQQLDEQLGKLLAIHHITLEAALLMELRIERIMGSTGQYYTRESKMHYNSIKNHLKGLAKDLEFFEVEIIPAMMTHDGKTDTINVYDSLQRDANSIARVLCRTFNAHSNDSNAIAKVEQAIAMLDEGNPQKIDESIIQSFKLNENLRRKFRRNFK